MRERRMREPDEDSHNDRVNGATYDVGYCKPPAHTRFKPGQSGNPTGRPKGSPNLKTLFHKILNEQISLQEGSQTKKISKGEALVRSLVIHALKGDTRAVMTLLRIAEATGEFENEIKNEPLTIQWQTASEEDDPAYRESLAAINQFKRDGR
jgi:hypothetical protein